MSCPFLTVSGDAENNEEFPACTLSNYAPVDNLNLCDGGAYETCNKLKDYLTMARKDEILAIVEAEIQNASNDLKATFRYLGDEAARTNYHALHRVAERAAMHHFNFSNVAYDYVSMTRAEFEYIPAMRLRDGMNEQIRSLNRAIGFSFNATIFERELNVSANDLSRVVEVFYSSINNVGAYLSCGELAQLENAYANRVMEQMVQVSGIVTNYLERLGGELSGIRTNFMQEMDSVVRAARRDGGNTLDKTDIEWHF